MACKEARKEIYDMKDSSSSFERKREDEEE